MNFDLVRKNAAFRLFEKDVRRGAPCHAYVVIGEDDEMRKAFLTLATMLLNCPTACGECETCLQIMNGEYVEMLWLDAANKINVETTEDLLEKIETRCVVGKRKTVIIDNAELLTPAVQNKLLKTYEEPPAYVTFFMAAKHENGLLATIRSRGKKLYLEELTAEEIATELTDEGYEPHTAQAAAAFSMGNYAKAERICQDEGYRDAYEQTFAMMSELKRSSQVPEYVYGGLFEKDTIKRTLEFMEILLCDVLKIVTGSGAPLFNAQREYDVRKIAEEYTPQSAAAAIGILNDGRSKLYANMNPYAVAGYIWMELLEAKYIWRKK